MFSPKRLNGVGRTLKKLKKMTIIEHKSTGVQFKFIRIECPQFSTIDFAVLLNLKTKKVEKFFAHTYLKYFKKIN